MTYLWFLSLFLNGTFLGWVFAFLSADLRGFPQTQNQAQGQYKQNIHHM